MLAEHLCVTERGNIELYTGTGLTPILGPSKASDNACRLQEPWLACPDWEEFDDKEENLFTESLMLKEEHIAVFSSVLRLVCGQDSAAPKLHVQ